ncbi:hypothetical protein I3842_07G055600 [Carya illinoinensis]|uniref:Uncharacterized protein n=1 Tax=Carya illinoinensis TaxID=32201 RepID=A0A922EIR0_CARIL|nr:hypothetical protein I3842_07G055600 [Carya illinoinensis]
MPIFTRSCLGNQAEEENKPLLEDDQTRPMFLLRILEQGLSLQDLAWDHLVARKYTHACDFQTRPISTRLYSRSPRRKKVCYCSGFLTKAPLHKTLLGITKQE